MPDTSGRPKENAAKQTPDGRSHRLPGLNRRVTFSHAVSNNVGQEWFRYALVSVTGNLINFIVYVVCIRLSQTMYTYPEIALAIASIVALAFNYLGYSRYAFRRDAG